MRNSGEKPHELSLAIMIVPYRMPGIIQNQRSNLKGTRFNSNSKLNMAAQIFALTFNRTALTVHVGAWKVDF